MSSLLAPLPLAIGSDHAGHSLKEALKEWGKGRGFTFLDVGCDSMASVDYPDYAFQVVQLILSHQAKVGILVCGSGIGMSIAANRHQGIRAALCTSEFEARLSRQHNDANILCLGARVLGEAHAMACLEIFLTTPFEAGRHQERLCKIDQKES